MRVQVKTTRYNISNLRNVQLRDITDFDEETRNRLVRSRNRSPSVPYANNRVGGWRRS